ncbi:amino acid ABC transporter ATP-binding protein [bacterium]|nr:amino acid ABC transporter ATP-binding protein [bacterium]
MTNTADSPTLPAVRVEHARKSFGDREVLHDVSLTIMPGQVVSLIGPSGAGKSTMLRCLTLLDRFDAATFAYGDLTVCAPGKDGAAAYDKVAVKQARMRFGLAFQNYNLFPHYTVLRNVTDAPIRVQRRDREKVTAQAMALLDRLGLSDHADKVPCELSGGQQQRVAIARALCMNPKVMYFDEATSALDPKLTADMHDLIRELAADGMAVGIVTHEMGFARDVSDRIAFLFDGAIVEEGPAQQVINSPRDPRTADFLSSSTD